MANLLLHCGSQAVTRDEISNVKTPEGTRTWAPISHHNLLGLVEATLKRNGFRIVNDAHALSGNSARYFGLIEVANGKPTNGYSLVVGVRNSHDKSFPAGLALGSQVLVCDNLSFFGEVTLARRHTRFIARDLPELVCRGVSQLTEQRQKQDERIEAYKSKRISDRRAHDLLIRCLDARVLPSTRIQPALNEWRNPSHPEFTEHGRSVWRFHNAITECDKGRSLAALPRRSAALNGILDAECGIAA